MALTGVTFAPEVLVYLELHHIITLSTSSFTGLPHASTVAYVNDDGSIFFGADQNSVVARNIRDNHYVSFTIDDYTPDWRKLRELVGIGSCGPADEADLARVAAIFDRQYGGTAYHVAGTMYRIRPGEVHFVDYDYGTVVGEHDPAMTSRVYQLEGVMDRGDEGAVSTDLDRASFAAGDVVFRPGDKAGQFWIVASGLVEVRTEGVGADQTVTRFGPGQMFGDRGALRGRAGALTAHAVEDTELMAVRADSVRDLLIKDDE